MLRRCLLLVLLVLSGQVAAVDRLQPFVSGSMAKILAQHQGQALIVAFWSVGCTHCPVELKALGALKRRYPALRLVLVAADTPEDAPEIERLASRYGLGKVEQWVFADPVPERLRAEIDRRWWGELPRTHFYDAEHRVEAVSGVVPPARLQGWVKANVK